MTSTRLPVGGGFARFVLVATTATIAVLTFLFSFRNVWVLGDFLKVDAWIAPLVGPAVDLSVVGLLVTVQWLSLAGATRDELRPARRLLYACGVVTLLLNSLPSAIEGWTTGDPRAYGRAAFEAIAPWLLIAWSHVGPWLLRLFLTVRERAEQVRTVEVPSADMSAPVREQEGDLSAPVPDVAAGVSTADVAMSETLRHGPDEAGGQAADQQEQAGPDIGRADLRDWTDLDLVELVREQAADRVAAGTLSRSLVEKLTGLSARRAEKIRKAVLDSRGHVRGRAGQPSEQTEQAPELVAAR